MVFPEVQCDRFPTPRIRGWKPAQDPQSRGVLNGALHEGFLFPAPVQRLLQSAVGSAEMLNHATASATATSNRTYPRPVPVQLGQTTSTYMLARCVYACTYIVYCTKYN